MRQRRIDPRLDADSVRRAGLDINEPSRVFVARRGKNELTSVILTADQVAEVVERMLSSSSWRLDISSPFVDPMLPGGHRLHVVLGGISRDVQQV